MTPEVNLWKYLNDGMKCQAGPVAWLAQRHEDKLGLGVPDVSFAIARNLGHADQRRQQGWIELKAIPDLPSREKTAVRIDHLTGAQRVWLSSRAEVGGNTWLLLRVVSPRRHLLFTGEACLGLGYQNWENTKKSARVVWDEIDFAELAAILLKEG